MSTATHGQPSSPQLAEQYRVAVNKELGEELVSEVRFIVSRKVAEEHKLHRAEEQSRGVLRRRHTWPQFPLSESRWTDRASVAEIPDEELREAVFRATVKDLEWKKGLSSGFPVLGTARGLLRPVFRRVYPIKLWYALTRHPQDIVAPDYWEPFFPHGQQRSECAR